VPNRTGTEDRGIFSPSKETLSEHGKDKTWYTGLSMTFIDIALLVLLGGFILAGFWFGVIHMVGSLVGLILGAVLAGRFYDDAALWAAPYLGGNSKLASILMFFLIFVLVTRLVGLLVLLADKVFKFVAIIPFLKSFNRLLGALFGLIEGTLVLGLVVYFAGRFPVNAAFEMALRNSQIARALNVIGTLLAPLLPKALRALQSVL
jgi:membrane protein required for colicin V production